jgi:hypothetical protein
MSSTTPDTTDDAEQTFIHNLAIKLSRELNTLNPNDLLARNVIDIASTSPSLAPFAAAAAGFGLKRESFLNELYMECTQHAAQAKQGLVVQPVHGIVVHDSEVLAPDPVREGGLVRKEKDAVCLHTTLLHGISADTYLVFSNIGSKRLPSLSSHPHPVPPCSDLTVSPTRNVRRDEWPTLKLRTVLESVHGLMDPTLVLVMTATGLCSRVRAHFSSLLWLICANHGFVLLI